MTKAEIETALSLISQTQRSTNNTLQNLNDRLAFLEQHIAGPSAPPAEEKPQLVEKKSIWNYLPPEIELLVIDGQEVFVGSPGELFPTKHPNFAKVIRRPKE